MLRRPLLWLHGRQLKLGSKPRQKQRLRTKSANGPNPSRRRTISLCGRPSLPSLGIDLEDKHIPAKEYIEKKLHELETGEFRAEPLTEVISRDEVDPDVLLQR